MTVFPKQCSHVTGSGITNLYVSQCRVFTRGPILREENVEERGCVNAIEVRTTLYEH